MIVFPCHAISKLVVQMSPRSPAPFCVPVTGACKADLFTDIGAIMHVTELRPCRGAAVSWTNKHITYFLHVIDRSLVRPLSLRRCRYTRCARFEETTNI